MIKAVIFDVGGVLVNASPVFDEIVGEFHLDKNKAAHDYEKIIRKHEKGLIDEKTFWKILKKKFRISKPIPNPSPLINRYRKEIKIDHNILRIALALKEKGYRTAVLSNVVPTHASYLKGLGLYKHFDIAILSHKEGLLKPDPKIFKLAARKLNVLPRECLFIDDVEAYMKGAERTGMKGIRFVNAKKLEKDIAQILASA